MNNQQDSNEITYEVIKLKAHHAWYEKRIAGDPSLDFYDGYDIGFNAGLKYQSNIINESIKEQDLCNYCGKTIREQAKGCNEIPCYRHPRWHIRHWKIQFHPIQNLKRRYWDKCCVCGKRGFKSSAIGDWNGTKIWHQECDITSKQPSIKH